MNKMGKLLQIAGGIWCLGWGMDNFTHLWHVQWPDWKSWFRFMWMATNCGEKTEVDYKSRRRGWGEKLEDYPAWKEDIFKLKLLRILKTLIRPPPENILHIFRTFSRLTKPPE